MRRRKGTNDDRPRQFTKELPESDYYLSVTDKHSGRYPCTGGDYGYGRDLYPVTDVQGQITGAVVRYWTTAWLDFCGHRGEFQQCSPWCQYEIVPIENLDEEVREALLRGDERYDATGHSYSECLVDGGCIYCYPCYHEECYDYYDRE
ncbi:MAG: hypothetical protein KatS3mg023_3924 [Armatimonadota bacterium]|nr:MAG: hypothetical protein KatS3mg023_3924 [Armatimonadota bacterium]